MGSHGVEGALLLIKVLFCVSKALLLIEALSRDVEEAFLLFEVLLLSEAFCRDVKALTHGDKETLLLIEAFFCSICLKGADTSRGQKTSAGTVAGSPDKVGTRTSAGKELPRAEICSDLF